MILTAVNVVLSVFGGLYSFVMSFTQSLSPVCSQVGLHLNAEARATSDRVLFALPVFILWTDTWESAPWVSLATASSDSCRSAILLATRIASVVMPFIL